MTLHMTKQLRRELAQAKRRTGHSVQDLVDFVAHHRVTLDDITNEVIDKLSPPESTKK